MADYFAALAARTLRPELSVQPRQHVRWEEAAEPMTEGVPVAGGLAALAALADVAPVPDRARFVAEVARVIYSLPSTGPYSNEPIRRRIETFFTDARQRAAGSPDEAVVPVPLSAALWSQAVFHRQVDRRDLIGAILADRSAALIS